MTWPTAPTGRGWSTASLADSRLRIWDVATARVRKEIELPAGRLRFVTVRPDGRRLAVTATPLAGMDFRLHVCDVASGERLFSADGVGLAYSPDGRWLAVRRRRREERCPPGRRDARDGRPIPRPREAGHVGHLQPRRPSARLVQSGPHRSRVADRRRRVPGAARAHRRRLRGGLPPRRHAPGDGRPRPGGLAVGPVAGRGGGAAARAHQTTSGRWPSAPTARRWRPAPATSRSACGTRRR